MKKFTTTVGVIREVNEKELSALQKSYREYFGAKMEKFGVKSPAELDDAQKKEFFNEITKDWEKGKGASEAGKKDVEEHGVKESEELNEGVEKPNDLADFINKEAGHFAAFLKPKKLTAVADGDIVTIKPASGSFTITVDYSKSTINTTGKPAYPESVSYVELMEYIKITKFKINESEVIDEAKTNESLWVIGGVVLLTILGIRGVRQIIKNMKVNANGNAEQSPEKLKELVTKIYEEGAESLPGGEKNKAKVWLDEMIVKIDAGELKTINDLEKFIDSKFPIMESSEENIDEAQVNEKDIKSKEDFKAFAEDKLKKQHGDDYDQDKADKVIKGLSDEAEESGDWGAAVGKLNKA